MTAMASGRPARGSSRGAALKHACPSVENFPSIADQREAANVPRHSFLPTETSQRSRPYFQALSGVCQVSQKLLLKLSLSISWRFVSPYKFPFLASSSAIYSCTNSVTTSSDPMMLKSTVDQNVIWYDCVSGKKYMVQNEAKDKLQATVKISGGKRCEQIKEMENTRRGRNPSGSGWLWTRQPTAERSGQDSPAAGTRRGVRNLHRGDH